MAVPDRIFTPSMFTLERTISPASVLSERLFAPNVPPVPAGNCESSFYFQLSKDLKFGFIPENPVERQRWVRPVKVANPTCRILAFPNFGSSGLLSLKYHSYLQKKPLCIKLGTSI